MGVHMGSKKFKIFRFSAWCVNLRMQTFDYPSKVLKQTSKEILISSTRKNYALAIVCANKQEHKNSTVVCISFQIYLDGDKPDLELCRM